MTSSNSQDPKLDRWVSAVFTTIYVAIIIVGMALLVLACLGAISTL